MISKYASILLFSLFLTVGSALAAEPAAPDNKDRCPVCGMFVSPYPDWIATIVFQDGSQHYFDGCKDMFRYYFKLPIEAGQQSQKSITSIHVTEYYRRQMISTLS